MKSLNSYGVVSSGGSLNHFMSGIVSSNIESGFQSEHLDNLKKILGKRSTVLYNELKHKTPSSLVRHISVPEGIIILTN